MCVCVCVCVCESMSVHVQSMIVAFVSESHSDNHTLNKAVACFHIRSSSIVSKQCRYPIFSKSHAFYCNLNSSNVHSGYKKSTNGHVTLCQQCTEAILRNSRVIIIHHLDITFIEELA